MILKRIQLTLFPDAQDCGVIEMLRQRFNPQQFALIPAHVTLCREDELGTPEMVMQQLADLHFDPSGLVHLNHPGEISATAGCITIDFGPAIRFNEGAGVLMPAIGENQPFHTLRKMILGDDARRHEPHITLMHPRNSTCTDDIFEQIKNAALPARITFRKICLIEQENGGVWKVVKEIELGCFYGGNDKGHTQSAGNSD